MGTGETEEMGPFAVILTWVGIIAGGGAGVEIAGGWGLLIGAVIFGIIGACVGKVIDGIVAFLIALTILVVIALINSAIRHFIWSLIMAIFQ